MISGVKKACLSLFLIGIIVHFFAKQQRQHATLAVRNIYGSHTALNILSVLKEVMMEWSIPKEAIGKVITDNGSNMLKAFRIFQNMTHEEQPATVEINDDDLFVVDSEDEDGQKEDEANENDDDDESNDELGEDDCGADDIARDIEEFDDKEESFDTVFSSEDYERLSCFAHTLQLVVSKFDEVRACKEAIKRAEKLVAKINKSVKATEMIKKLSGIKVLSAEFYFHI